MLNAGAGGHAPQMGIVTSGGHVGGISVAVLWRRWSSSLVAFRDRARTAASRHIIGGAMPARIGNWLTGVACRQPKTVRKAC